MKKSTCCLGCRESVSHVNKVLDETDEEMITFLNLFLKKDNAGYCQRCLTIDFKIRNIYNELKTSLITKTEIINVITMDVPGHWEYKIKGLVSAHSFTQPYPFCSLNYFQYFNSFINYRSLKERSHHYLNAEIECLFRLRIRAILMEANVVVKTNIAYNLTIGNGQSDGIFFTATGTAIEASHLKTCDFTDLIEELFSLEKILTHLKIDGIF